MTDTHSPKLTCAECGRDISVGDERIPTEDGTIHRICIIRREIRNTYAFSIGNPTADTHTVSMWYRGDEREYPIIQNTGGLTIHMSSSPNYGDGDWIEPTGEFAETLAYAYHWLQSYRPLPTKRELIADEIDGEIDSIYPNGNVADHERWAIHEIVTRLYLSRQIPPEWKPIVDYCDAITAFSVPEVEPW